MSQFTTKDEFADICGCDMECYGTVEGKYNYELTPIDDYEQILPIAISEKVYLELLKKETLSGNKLSKEEIIHLHENIYLSFSKIINETLKQFMISDIEIKSDQDIKNENKKRIEDYNKLLKKAGQNPIDHNDEDEE